MKTPPYCGPVEALSYEQVAIRINCSVDYLKKSYDGPKIHLFENGGGVRILAQDLHHWLYARKNNVVQMQDDPWAGVGLDGEEGALSRG